MKIRPATLEDTKAISRLLYELAAVGKRTRPSDEAFVLSNYIIHPDGILTSVAVDEGGLILGFQSLRRAEIGNEFDVEVGWGIIGTHVAADAGRRGVGSALFKATLIAAAQEGLTDIDATIGADNADGLGYYEAMGFRTYATTPDKVRKRLSLR